MSTRKNALKLLEALSDDTRFQIVELLLGGRKCVCEISPRVKKAQPTVSLHLKKLEMLGVIKSKREGKRIFYEIRDKRVCDVFKALGHIKAACLKPKCCMAE